MALVLGEDVEQLRRRAGEVDLAHAGRHRALQEALHARVVDRAERVGEEARGVGGDGVRVRRLQQPAAQRVRGPELGDALHQRRGGEEVVLDEFRKPARDPLLVARDDRGVRDRQVERPAEQRHHREPVGERADHRGLGEGGGVVELVLLRHHVAHGRGQQQSGSPPVDAHFSRLQKKARLRGPVAAGGGACYCEPSMRSASRSKRVHAARAACRFFSHSRRDWPRLRV